MNNYKEKLPDNKEIEIDISGIKNALNLFSTACRINLGLSNEINQDEIMASIPGIKAALKTFAIACNGIPKIDSAMISQVTELSKSLGIDQSIIDNAYTLEENDQYETSDILLYDNVEKNHIETISSEINKISSKRKYLYYVIIFLCVLAGLSSGTLSINDKNNFTIEQKEESSLNVRWDNVLGLINFSTVMIMNNYKRFNKFCSENPIVYDFIKCIMIKMISFISGLLKTDFNEKKKKLKLRKVLGLISSKIEEKSDSPLEMDLVYKLLRVVNKDEVEVRTAASKASPILYKLHYKDLVQIKKQKKNWSRIEFKSEDGNIYVGWVLTRYLEKFKYAN